MNRRNFLRSMLGVAAATALPSAVWPFRKIFLPSPVNTYLPLDYVTRLTGLSAYTGVDSHTWLGLDRSPYPGQLSTPLKINDIAALQLEQFAKEIPDLVFHDTAIYRLFKRHAAEAVWTDGIAVVQTHPPMRIPQELHYLNEAYVESDMIVTDVDPIEKSVTLAPAPKRSLLHAPATPENVLEFIDGLESDLS